MHLNHKRRVKVLNKELLKVEKQEKKMEQMALKEKSPIWKSELERKVPSKVYTGLESAFCKGFTVVFNLGGKIIEKSYDKEVLNANYAIRDYAIQLKGGHKEFRKMYNSAKYSNLLNLTVTTVEGIGLGALGIGMPDILLFLSILLKGIYEAALNYGFEYESRREQMLILKMMETAMLSGECWRERNYEVDRMLEDENIVEFSDEEFKYQIERTSAVFSTNMILLKFIQGLPILGIIGGATNPVYFNKVMKYIQLKYKKKYIMKWNGNKNETRVDR